MVVCANSLTRVARRSVVRNQLDFIRMGDLMALRNLVSAIEQIDGMERSVGIANYRQVAEFLPELGVGFFRGDDGSTSFPDNVDLWETMRSLTADGWRPIPNTERRNDLVVVAPLWQADYNRDRSWSPEFTRDLVAALHGSGQRVVVIGAKGTANWSGVDPRICVEGSLRRSCALIRGCRSYIGGDTGLTHYAAALEGDADIVAVYGCGSTTRADFSPVVWPAHRYLYLEFPWVSAAAISQWCDQDRD